jgi:CHAT domain-containing protein
LIEELAIAVVPVASLMPELLASNARAEDAEKGALLLVGDVDFDGELSTASAAGVDRVAVRGDEFYNWSQLPGTRAEVAAIREIFAKRAGTQSAVELTGGRATKSAVRAEAGRNAYLHISTHGFFAQPQAGTPLKAGTTLDSSAADQASGLHPELLSGLVLTGANRRSEAGQADGILTALEVREMDLRHVRLATLSACETGLGKAEGGEGLLGLQRAFQVAGAKALVSSLWKVDDAATQVLMTEFYRNLWEKKLGKLEALRQAQLTMLKRYSTSERRLRGLMAADEKAPMAGNSPFYWGAWVLSGDWR